MAISLDYEGKHRGLEEGKWGKVVRGLSDLLEGSELAVVATMTQIEMASDLLLLLPNCNEMVLTLSKFGKELLRTKL